MKKKGKLLFFLVAGIFANLFHMRENAATGYVKFFGREMKSQKQFN